MTGRTVSVGDVSLEVVEVGKGAPVVLLHGFPQFSYAFRHQLAELERAGYRAVAPNLRGYQGSDKPEALDAYALDRLVGDVVGLLDALAIPKVTLVGHDWGGVIAYATAERHPERVERLVVLNAAHPELYRRGMMRPSQVWKSWYVLFFQLPGLPELLVQSRDYLEEIMQEEAPDAFPDAILDVYLAGLRRPGVAKAAINYYRAAREHPIAAPGTIGAKTLVLWGDNDEALSRELLQGLAAYVPDHRVVHLPKSSHWVAEDEPDRVTSELLAFLRT